MYTSLLSQFARKGLMAVVKMDHEQLDILKAFLKAFVPAKFKEDVSPGVTAMLCPHKDWLMQYER